MAERSIRDFQAPFVVAPVADAWAGANGFALGDVEPDGSRHYVRGSGLLTGQMMCVVRQFGPHVRIEAYVHARTVARISALFLIPVNISIEPGGLKGGLPRKMCRDAVDKLLAQLGQPPITVADNAGPAAAGPQTALRIAPAYPAAPAYPVAPTPPAAFAAAQPTPAAWPAGAGYPPAVGPGYAATVTRPFGILVVAAIEAVNAVVSVGVVRDYWSGFDYRTSYDEMNWAALDLVMALAYLALVGGSIAVAWRLWSMRRDAWLAAIQLCVAMVAVTVVSDLIWGFEAIGIAGIGVHLGIIGYLNMTPVRALFGRGPLAASPS